MVNAAPSAYLLRRALFRKSVPFSWARLMESHHWARSLAQHFRCGATRQVRCDRGCGARAHHNQIGAAFLCQIDDPGSGSCIHQPGSERQMSLESLWNVNIFAKGLVKSRPAQVLLVAGAVCMKEHELRSVLAGKQ